MILLAIKVSPHCLNTSMPSISVRIWLMTRSEAPPRLRPSRYRRVTLRLSSTRRRREHKAPRILLCRRHVAHVRLSIFLALPLELDRLALAVDDCVRRHDAVGRGVGLHHLELHCPHPASHNEGVSLVDLSVRLQEVRYTWQQSVLKNKCSGHALNFT